MRECGLAWLIYFGLGAIFAVGLGIFAWSTYWLWMNPIRGKHSRGRHLA